MNQIVRAVLILVLLTAIGWGAYQLYDNVSGQKAAREATQAMLDKASEWKNTKAKTIFD